MKTNNIFVGINSATLALTRGRAIAVYPPKKGQNVSYMLLESGQVSKVTGARINGVSISRYLKENGFELAQPGDKRAARLADLVDVLEGTNLVEDATKVRARELQEQFAGQACTFVPFDGSRPIEQVNVSEPRGASTVAMDLTTGVSSGAVNIEYTPGSGLSSLALSAGWLVGPEGDAALMPRNTDYGGIIEQAVYVICNAGMGCLIGEHNLVATGEGQYPRGNLELALTNGDRLRVGIDAGDELEVCYLRDGARVYSRAGLYSVRLADAIGAIAAVLVRVSELDASRLKSRRKAA